MMSFEDNEKFIIESFCRGEMKDFHKEIKFKTLCRYGFSMGEMGFSAEQHFFESKIHDTNVFIIDSNAEELGKNVLSTPDDKPLCLPFKTCSFELARFIPLGHFSGTEQGGIARLPICLWIHEVSPAKYLSICSELWFDPASASRGHAVSIIDIVAGDQDSVLGPLLRYLQRKNLMQGEIKRPWVKSGTGRHSKNVRPNRVVVIRGKTQQENPLESHLGEKIIWSHRWEVMGHWRKVAAIGKNRDGEYIVPGHTWVKECVKGNVEKPIVKKTRVWMAHPAQDKALSATEAIQRTV
jgi:hypothetical protein